MIAVLCSDIHLSHKAPISRSNEEDWYAAMKRPLHELHAISEEYQCPIICAGDIFDRWDSPAELINFALDTLPPDMYCIPGQHDLPNHDLNQIERSAYWTLVQAEKITSIGDKLDLGNRHGTLHGFAWGREVQPIEQREGRFNLAVVHAYIWYKEHGYPGAPEGARVKNWLDRIGGYDAAVFGDNHKGFKAHHIFNCGTLMRRKIDEYNYKPQVGLLHRDGTISTHYLDCSEDKFIDPNDKEQYRDLISNDENTEEFLSQLAGLGGATIDFLEAVKRFLRDDNNKVSPSAKRVILAAMEEEGKRQNS